MVVASVAEVEYAAAFGGGQVLVELTLILTNLGHPQQSPPLLFVDNECNRSCNFFGSAEEVQVD